MINEDFVLVRKLTVVRSQNARNGSSASGCHFQQLSYIATAPLSRIWMCTVQEKKRYAYIRKYRPRTPMPVHAHWQCIEST